MTAANAMSGLVGWTRMRLMCRESDNPMNSQVAPASRDFHMPLPLETLPRQVFSPPPT